MQTIGYNVEWSQELRLEQSLEEYVKGAMLIEILLASGEIPIAPDFAHHPKAGRDRQGAFVIEADQREGLHGYWTRTYPVTGGSCYRFQAFRKVERISTPRRSALVKLTWQDDQGRLVPSDRTVVDFYRTGSTSVVQPEYPTDKQTCADGWTEVSDTYRAPAKAARAVVELHLRWAPGGRIEWSCISLSEAQPLSRKVRLAAVHFRPRGGKTPAGNCRLFAPLIAKAAEQKADLVVLPETLTFYGTGLKHADAAETVPGPSTEYFGQLARQHNLYIVAGLIERHEHLIYNVAVLVGPRRLSGGCLSITPFCHTLR
jgi:hypothetical protein